MTTVVEAPAASAPRPAPRRRSKRWLRLVVPYAIVVVLLLVSVVAYVIEEPDPENTDYLSPVSTADIGSSELAGRLRQRGITIERQTSTAAALRSAHRGGATLFVTTPGLVHSLYLRMLKLMPASTTVVLVRPDNKSMGRGGLPGRVTGNRWAGTAAAPGCGYGPAREAGVAGVRRTTYQSALPLDRCYADSLVRVAHHDTTMTFVGSADPFRNDRIGEHGNARLAVGLLAGAPRVVWLDLHGDEPGPKVHDKNAQGLDESPAPADLGPGSPDPDFPVPDPDGTQEGEADQPDEDEREQAGSSGPSVFDLFPAAAWTVLALLCVAALLAAAARARRLGAPVPEPLPVLVPTTETVTGRGRLYERSRDRGAALAVLRRAARDRITHALDLPPDAERATLVPAVVAQTGFDPGQVDTLLFGPDPETNEDLVHLAAALEILVETVTRIR
ncbi:DUF4350 domain-containing protein [Virgisporangium aurantiacum]|uniref:DUF4350 domain-containing protein n=1 Tax=Virgisporangium aurantiacum TaxID=175570 RepID=A0A8J4DWL1_9ACTN|nr:DUF4350 domain-containing protein [Virgisporangium aurantiacum]GIJ52989.1 hypothetical protein Vau01_005050 [Virgisporangium aurantiacum]